MRDDPYLENALIFLDGPLAFLDIRVQVVEPAFAALLATAASNDVRAVRPFRSPILANP